MEDEIQGQLMDAAGLGDEPQVEAQPEPQVAPQPQMEAPQMPQFDPNLFVGALDNVHTRLDELQQPQGQQVAPQPTEEDLILKDVAQKLGLDKIQEENAQYKQMLEEMKSQQAQAQEFIQKQQIEHTQNSILAKHEGITKEMVYGKLQEIARTHGEEFATNMNNPQGWEYLISTQIQRPQSTPDPIVSTESGADDFLSSASERVSKGQPKAGDIGDLLASMA